MKSFNFTKLVMLMATVVLVAPATYAGNAKSSRTVVENVDTTSQSADNPHQHMDHQSMGHGMGGPMMMGMMGKMGPGHMQQMQEMMKRMHEGGGGCPMHQNN